MSSMSASDMLTYLSNVKVDVAVDVVLVGFNEVMDGSGEGETGLEKSLEDHLAKLVQGLSADGEEGNPIMLVRCASTVPVFLPREPARVRGPRHGVQLLLGRHPGGRSSLAGQRLPIPLRMLPGRLEESYSFVCKIGLRS